MTRAVLVGLVVLAISVVVDSASPDLQANSPGPTPAPLLSCPDVDGNGVVRVPDIQAVVLHYGNDAVGSYRFLYDTNADGRLRIPDIIAVVNRYGTDCPLVDTQVAQATRWILEEHPELLVEDTEDLAAAGYLRASSDVPGQGVHYVNRANWWDVALGPKAPEGLVYDNGRLAAHLYVVDGAVAGWAGEDPVSNLNPGGPCNDGIDNGNDGLADLDDSDCILDSAPTSAPLDNINFDTFCQLAVPCSWDGSEGWHLHYRLCTTHAGTPYAFAFPLSPGSDAGDCENSHNQCLSCGGTWHYADRVGWMGHLWNHLPNANLIPDDSGGADPGSLNGRFADCYPDGGIWKAHNCPQ